jgi:hypothetical protein
MSKPTTPVKPVLGFRKPPEPHWVGDGFLVYNLISYNRMGEETSPFLLLDYGAPREVAPSEIPAGVGEHPHRGFETVTIDYSGEIRHRDSSGGGGIIGPGDVQWMTAGGGLVHEEKYSQEFSRRGGTAEMVQLWVNLPAKHKLTKPRYQDLRDSAIPKVELPGGGMARVIAGELAGASGPALTHTPVALWDLRLKEGKTAEFDFPEDHSVSLLVLKGGVAVNGGESAGRGELAVFHQYGRRVTLAAKADSTVLLMSGEPIREPIAGYGPFVMNTKEEINDAMRDYASGKMGHLD